jgi:hypothetical protein
MDICVLAYNIRNNMRGRIQVLSGKDKFIILRLAKIIPFTH